MESTTVYGFLPYLRTAEAVKLRGLVLRSSDDLEGLSDVDRDAIAFLGGTFVAHDGSPLGNVVYFVSQGVARGRIDDTLSRQLSELQLLISYLYTGVQHTGEPFLTAEHSSLFVFRAERIPALLPFPAIWKSSPDTASHGDLGTGFIDAYHGVRDWDCHFWVTKGSKVFPQFPHFYRNHSQTLASDLSQYFSQPYNWAIARLFRSDALPEEIRERVFVALKWYAASCRFATDEAEKLLFLAIALESLLKVREGEGLTERFKDAVVTLLGPVPRLDSWLDQFYHERSKTVHEGKPHRLSFFAADKALVKQFQKGAKERTQHGSLLTYGRRIFRLCLNGILTGATLAHDANLAMLFVPNSERLTSIATILTAANSTPDERLRKACPLMAELCRADASPNESLGFGVDLEQVCGVARVALKTLSDLTSVLSPEASKLVADAIAHTGEVTSEQYERLVTLAHLLQEASDSEGVGVAGEALLGVSLLLSFLSAPTFRLRVTMAERRARSV